MSKLTAKEARDITYGNAYDDGIVETKEQELEHLLKIVKDIALQGASGVYRVKKRIDDQDDVQWILSEMEDLGYYIRVRESTYSISWKDETEPDRLDPTLSAYLVVREEPDCISILHTCSRLKSAQNWAKWREKHGIKTKIYRVAMDTDHAIYFHLGESDY